MSTIYSVSQLSNYIQSLVNVKKVRVEGEVVQPKVSGNHLYFSIKDNTANLKAIIWNNKNIDYDTIQAGNKIVLECRVDFYGPVSTINLIVDKIISNEGKGEQFIKYEKYKNEFENKGYFDKNRKKELPDFISNILVITSEKGAALQDFIHNLDSNHSNINYMIADVMVQGTNCPRDICDVLDDIIENNHIFDLIVITRGGGSFEELFGFSQPELIECVYNFQNKSKVPILSAIGHMVDNPLLDLVADHYTATPSLAAQFLVDYNNKYIDMLNKKKNYIKTSLITDINNNIFQLHKLNDRLKESFNELHNIKRQYMDNIINQINSMKIKYNQLENKIILEDNIIILVDGIKMVEPTQLDGIKKATLQWKDKIWEIELKN
jgi:exodeoxyribonuclease VII large subunit